MIVLNRRERFEIEEKIKEFGIVLPLQHQFIRQAKDKIRIFTGNLSARDLSRLSGLLKIDNIGLYMAFIKGDDFRLSFDASILYGTNAKKVIELTEQEAYKWLSGQDLEITLPKQGYFLLKYDSDILGCGKATGQKILNFIPKERRILM